MVSRWNLCSPEEGQAENQRRTDRDTGDENHEGGDNGVANTLVPGKKDNKDDYDCDCGDYRQH